LPLPFLQQICFFSFFAPNNPNSAKANLHVNFFQFTDNNLDDKAYPNNFLDGVTFGG